MVYRLRCLRQCCDAGKPSSGMARGELRSTLSWAGSCRCRHAKCIRQNWVSYVLTICVSEVLRKTLTLSSEIEISKSSRRQPCCCAIDTVICFYTVACCLEHTLRVIWIGGHGCFFRTTCMSWFGVYFWVSRRYNERPNAGYVKKWVTWLSLYLLTGCESMLSSVAPISGCSVFLSDHATFPDFISLP